jgi:hypothetical protein
MTAVPVVHGRTCQCPPGTCPVGSEPDDVFVVEELDAGVLLSRQCAGGGLSNPVVLVPWKAVSGLTGELAGAALRHAIHKATAPRPAKSEP